MPLIRAAVHLCVLRNTLPWQPRLRHLRQAGAVNDSRGCLVRATAHDLSKPDPQVLPADQEPAAKPYLPYDDHLMEEADEAHRKTIEIRLFEAEWLGDGVLHAQCRAEMEQLLAVQIARGIRDIHNGFMSELEDLQKQLKKHQLWDHHQHKHQSRGLKATSQETALKTHKSAIHVMRQGSASGPDGLGEGTANGRGGVRDHVEEQCRCTRANQDAEVQTLTSALADREDEIRQMGAAMAASEEEVASLRREIEAQEVAYAGRVREIEARISAREAEVVVELWEASKAHEMVCRISVADREAKVRALTSALRESEAAGCSLRKAMAARETDVACLRREMEDARVEAAQKYAALVSSSAEMHGVLEALDASGRTIEAAEREKTAAESKCAEIEQMIRNRASEVEVLRRRDVELTVEVEKCAEDLRQSKASLVRKHEHVVALRSRMANFEWSLALAFDDLRTAAKEQIELMHTGSEGAERRLDEAVCELRGMATRMDENVAKLTGELQSSQDQVAGLIKVRDEKEERIKGLQQDVKDKEEALKSSQEEVARLMQLQAEKEESIKGLQQDVKDMEASVSKLNDELKSLQGVMAGLVKVRDEKEECIKGLQQEGQGKDASMHVASFVQDAFPSFLSDQLKSEREESSSEPIPAPSRALPLRSNLVQLPKNNGRFERDAAARESVTSEATEVHADVVAALAAATLKIEELESQLLLQHERAEAYDGRDLAVHAAVHASALHLAAPTSAAAQTATHQIHGLHYVADATAFVRDAVMTWREKDSAKSTSGISSGRRDGDDGDDAALTSAVTESAVAEGYKQSSKERYNCDAPQACAEKDVWSDIWMFDQVSSPTGILHVRSLMESVRHECGQAALVYILTSTPPLPY